MPLPVYQTVVANIQGQDGQPLQVVTPLVQVPKLEPGLEGNVEVSAGLNASLNASTIISSGQAQVQVREGGACWCVFIVFIYLVSIYMFSCFFCLSSPFSSFMFTVDVACRSWERCI